VKSLCFIAVIVLIFSVTEKMQQGLKLLSAGDVDGASVLFQEIIQENPQHGPARLMLGQIAFEKGELRRAQEHLEIAVASNPQRIHLAWHLLGKVYVLEHQYEKATEAFNRSVEKEPTAKFFLEALKDDESSGKNLKILLGENLGSSDAYVAAAIRFNADVLLQVAYNIDDTDPFIRLLLQKAGKSIPTFSLPKREVVQTLLNASKVLSENPQEAQSLAKKITVDRPMHIPALLIQIESAEKQKDNWNALSNYKQIMQSLPDVPAISLRFALLARDIEANQAAECAIQKALSIRPDDGSLYYIQATILKQEAKIDEALSACQKAIELGFKEAPVYVTLGNLYYEKMEISQSIDAFQTAIEKDPNSAEDIASFALSSLTTPDSEKLIQLLQKHIETHPENINTLYSLGVLYLNESKFDKAKEHFLKLTKLAPNNSQVYYNLSLLYTREGNDSEAKQAMTRFEELKNEERKEFLRQNHMYRLRIEAAEAKKNGDINKAIELYSEVIKDGSQEIKDFLALGELNLQQNQWKEAASVFEKVLQKKPYEIDAISGLLKAVQGMKDSEKITLYQHQLELLNTLCKK
jgi:tetratricopeptide (TPR) repeat protein